MSETEIPLPKRKAAWCRKLFKLYLKIVAQRGDPKYVAKGMALGLFMGLLIPMSIQLLITIPLALLFKVSVISASVGTFITNPWSVLVIYPTQIYVGKWMINFSQPSWADVVKLCESVIDAASSISITDMSTFTDFLQLGLKDIVFPFFVGGFLFGVIIAPIGYKLTLHLIKVYREKKQARRLKKKQARLQKNIMEQQNS